MDSKTFNKSVQVKRRSKRSSVLQEPAQSHLMAVGRKRIVDSSANTKNNNNESKSDKNRQAIVDGTIKKIHDETTNLPRETKVNDISKCPKRKSLQPLKETSVMNKGHSKKRKVIKDTEKGLSNITEPPSKKIKVWFGGVYLDPEMYPDLRTDIRREATRITKKNNELLSTVEDKKKPLREGLEAWNCMARASIPKSKTLLELVGDVHQAKGINELIRKVADEDGVKTMPDLDKEMMRVFKETENLTEA